MNSYDSYPAAPPSEMEWEDLLVRYELGPRALRIAIEDAENDAGADETVAGLVRVLTVHELQAAALFAAMRDGRPVDTQPRIEVLSPTPRAAYERYAGLRARNFATVQRRGIEVWEWRTEVPHAGPVTAHQLILASTALDGETLAGVRQALRGAGVC